MRKNIFYSMIVLSVLTASCNKFLDRLPDNRTELNTEEKILGILVSAYPDNLYNMSAEMSSDNTDDLGSTKHFSEVHEQLYNWEDVTSAETNEHPGRVWEACYGGIAAANQALQAIDEMGGPNTTVLSAAKGEALLCRAYNHWVLVNMFAMHYNRQHPEDPGIPYVDKPETELVSSRPRGTVHEVYDKIIKDIEEGLPLINESVYTQPAYHFNYKAACTFASRVCLLREEWEKAIEYATRALGGKPQVRDLVSIMNMDRCMGMDEQCRAYASSSEQANYMVATSIGYLGQIYGMYSNYARFNHGKLIGETETIRIDDRNGVLTPMGCSTYAMKVRAFTTGSGKYLLPRCVNLFEYTDPVQGTGYRHSMAVVFCVEEALLNRAEAYIMKKEYDLALADINKWATNFYRSREEDRSYYYEPVTRAYINRWFNETAYYTPEVPTPKKEMNPGFEIEKGGEQEAMLQVLLFVRRNEFIHTGMRWFDTRRYGITIYRRQIDDDGTTVLNVTDTMSDKDGQRDPRRCLQLPLDAIAAGMEPNIRTK